MQEPFEPPPVSPESGAAAASPADEIVAARDPAITHSANSEGPLREIAHAFRLNAEALHTLKQMQGDLAKQVRRGDRSELVVQSTQALNETFRNLSSVQQELLRRIKQGQDRSRTSLVPLMLIGLLVVLLGGIYVILDALERRGPVDPELAPAEVARREREAWKDGRQEGSSHAEREIQRLRASIEESTRRSSQLQGELEAKLERIAELDQRKRTVEVERDDFAGQVRKAQSEMMAKQVLEEEVGSLRLQLEASQRAMADAAHALDLERRKTSYLRERAADTAMGFTDDDPPWRPQTPPGDATKRRTSPQDFAAIGRDRLRALGIPTDNDAPAPAAGDSSVPAAAYPVGSPVGSPSAAEAGGVTPSARPAASGAAYGGDGPGVLPPPSIRRRGGDAPTALPGRSAVAPRARAEAPAVAPAERVRTRLNDLLRGSDTSAGGGWRLARVGGVSADELQGVLLLRYGPGGRVVESVEARSLRIDHDRTRREVEFALRDGARFVGGQRMPLPAVGSRVLVAQEAQAEAWSRAAPEILRSR